LWHGLQFGILQSVLGVFMLHKTFQNTITILIVHWRRGNDITATPISYTPKKAGDCRGRWINRSSIEKYYIGVHIYTVAHIARQINHEHARKLSHLNLSDWGFIAICALNIWGGDTQDSYPRSIMESHQKFIIWKSYNIMYIRQAEVEPWLKLIVRESSGHMYGLFERKKRANPWISRTVGPCAREKEIGHWILHNFRQRHVNNLNPAFLANEKSFIYSSRFINKMAIKRYNYGSEVNKRTPVFSWQEYLVR